MGKAKRNTDWGQDFCEWKAELQEWVNKAK